MMKIILAILSAVFLFCEALPNPPLDDECRPPPPDPQNRIVCCADAPMLLQLTKNDSSDTLFETCHTENSNGHPVGGAGSPPSAGAGAGGPPGPPPDFACTTECLFKQLNLLDTANKIDQEKIKKLVTMAFTGEWAADGTKALTTCLASYTSQIADQSTCKSGADEFMNCFHRFIFLNCPSSKWNSDAKCTTLKAQVEKCPNFVTALIM